ncbi:hypothetical protein GCM10027275_05200 [Rhabdobacter roseus]|uniref:Outer membrane protein n=1 Tax=Rhabdobacter roseus TaxID=1655419 RepID=A0A840TGR6_9BACT|nr:OmpH family outer membrane protein [Rhabdobacter roseus]MBB5282411.1 outer membrane protein [Rhabdobacter roseus]
MKNKLSALLVVLAMVSTPLLAQTTPTTATPTKIGYTNVDFILEALPDSKKMQNELEVTKAQLDKALQDKYKEFQEKLDIYNKGANNMSDVIRADKEKELQNLQTSIQEFQRNSEQSFQNKYQQLLQPVLAKINDAIQAVGKENGFLYILDSGSGGGSPTILYVGSEDYNATDLILKKMGVDPKAAAQQQPAATTPASTTTPAKTTTTPPKK